MFRKGWQHLLQRGLLQVRCTRTKSCTNVGKNRLIKISTIKDKLDNNFELRFLFYQAAAFRLE